MQILPWLVNCVPMEEPVSGFVKGSLVFLIVLVVACIVATALFWKKQTCYANLFITILIVMAYIMWACTYLSQMYPLIKPEISQRD